MQYVGYVLYGALVNICATVHVAMLFVRVICSYSVCRSTYSDKQDGYSCILFVIRYRSVVRVRDMLVANLY